MGRVCSSITVLIGLMACTEGGATEDVALDAAAAGSVQVDAGVEPELDARTPDEPEALTSIQVGELVFQARVAGPEDGVPVLLLHGFPQTSMQWRAQIEALAGAGYRVVAPDQRGYSPGARPRDVESYRALLLAQDAIGIADALHWTRFHLVGHDWGAGIAWIVGVIAPQRLLSIVPISVPHPDGFAKARAVPDSCQAAASTYMQDLIAADAEARVLAADAAWLRRAYRGLPDSLVETYVELFTDEALLTPTVNWYRANFGPDVVRVELGPVRVPTLYIWSDADEAVCRESAELARNYVDAPYQFEILEGVAHWVPELASERLNRLLLEHLQTHGAP
ncbi:MAG TPA: alpha/beta hydrolase, partial [Polyangiales bacterium]